MMSGTAAIARGAGARPPHRPWDPDGMLAEAARAILAAMEADPGMTIEAGVSVGFDGSVRSSGPEVRRRHREEWEDEPQVFYEVPAVLRAEPPGPFAGGVGEGAARLLGLVCAARWPGARAMDCRLLLGGGAAVLRHRVYDPVPETEEPLA